MNIWLIAKSNMKKKKSNVIVLFILIMIVTMLLYSSVTINKNVSSFIDEKNESVNGTHIELMTSKGFDKEVSDIIKSEKHYEDCLNTDAIVSISEAKVYNKDLDDNKESMSVCFNAYDPGHRNKICDYKIIDKGKKWENKIDVTVVMITVIVVTAMVLIITAITSSKIKKITPLDALLNGIQTHNFTKNHLPLLNSRLDLNSSLGIKNIFRHKKQNIAIAFIVALIVFSGEMMFSLYHNFVYDQDSLINLVGLEKPDILIKSKQSDINEGVDFDKMCDELVKEDNISRAITCRASNMIVKSKDNKMTISAEIYNEPEKVRINTLVSGRHVKHSNEINISSVVAERLGVNKGDTVMIESNKKEEAYVISGITQRISNLGISLIMSEEGAKRINCTAKPDSLYVYLNDASDIKGEIKQIKASYNNTSDIVYSDFDEIYQSVLSSFTGSLKSLCIIFVIVTIIVIALIILLVMKMKMVREKRNMGIYKAIGFTTIQIIWQNVMSFAPVISVGALAGVLIGKFGINKACVAALSLCGIIKANLTVPFLLVASIFVITTILSFIICILASLKVRKIEAYKMITEQ
ncbi:MAG: ABC transporter permease [Lachnospiraceae bacterium]|nr:ABC transporter permease [Lachnospiraceae bacterium]